MMKFVKIISNLKFDKKIFTCAFLFFLVYKIECQIDLYSQYYFFKPMQNPANTGLFDRKWKLFFSRRYQLHQNKVYNSHNQLISPEIKIALMRKTGEYGVFIKEYSGYMIGLGIIDYRVHHNNENDFFRSDFFSFAIHRQIKRKSENRKNQVRYFSFGLQPGYIRMYNLRSFDINAGMILSQEQIECWTEDQFFKTQIGMAGYHLLTESRRNDTSYYPGRRFHFHFGQLINSYKHLYFFVNTQATYDTQIDITVGLNVLFFPEVHYKYYDRGRLGLHYRTSNHLVISGGFRLYGKSARTISADLSGSIEIGMGFLDLIPRYKTAIEIGIILTPLHKCWPLTKC